MDKRVPVFAAFVILLATMGGCVGLLTYYAMYTPAYYNYLLDMTNNPNKIVDWSLSNEKPPMSEYRRLYDSGGAVRHIIYESSGSNLDHAVAAYIRLVKHVENYPNDRKIQGPSGVDVNFYPTNILESYYSDIVVFASDNRVDCFHKQAFAGLLCQVEPSPEKKEYHDLWDNAVQYWTQLFRVPPDVYARSGPTEVSK